MKFRTFKYQLHPKKEEKQLLLFLTHISKNLYNSALYYLRQPFFTKEHLDTSFDTNKVLANNENYHILNTYKSLCTIRTAHTNMTNFLKRRSKGAQLPKYLPKDSYFPLITDQIRKYCKNRKNI